MRRAKGRQEATRQAGAWQGGTLQREAHSANPMGDRCGALLDSPTHQNSLEAGQGREGQWPHHPAAASPGVASKGGCDRASVILQRDN